MRPGTGLMVPEGEEEEEEEEQEEEEEDKEKQEEDNEDNKEDNELAHSLAHSLLLSSSVCFWHSQNHAFLLHYVKLSHFVKKR